MRRIISILFFLLCLVQANAQSGQSKIILKNGTVLKGVLKSINPAEALTITIGGVDMTIKMADVVKIEEESSESSERAQLSSSSLLSPTEKLIVTETEDYPESFNLEILGTTIKMILVKGGEMNMGYDGDGSRGMKSRPVHKVKVTSFYISDEFIPTRLAAKLTSKKIDTDWPYHEDKWIELSEMANSIGKEVGMPVRLPLEAEWEFAACSKQQSSIFTKCDNNEFCYDFFAPYENSSEVVVDPEGPKNGKKHVVRYYGNGNAKEKFDRSDYDPKNHFRIVIKAKDVKF